MVGSTPLSLTVSMVAVVVQDDARTVESTRDYRFPQTGRMVRGGCFGCEDSK